MGRLWEEIKRGLNSPSWIDEPPPEEFFWPGVILFVIIIVLFIYQ